MQKMCNDPMNITIVMGSQISLYFSMGHTFDARNSMAQFWWYDCTFKKQCTVPVTLTVDL